MREIPSIPTDSLYKFMAITGIILLFGSALLLYKFLHVDEAFELYNKSNAVLAESKETLNNIIRKEKRGVPVYNDTVIHALAKMDQEYYDSTKAWYTRNINDLEIISHKVSRDNDKIISFAIYLILGLAVAGLALIIWGFTLWYVRVQRYIDYKTIKETAPSADLEEIHEEDGYLVKLYQIYTFVAVIAIIGVVYFRNKPPYITIGIFVVSQIISWLFSKLYKRTKTNRTS